MSRFFVVRKETPMAKDDYHYIVFKILTYLYAVLKRKQSFDAVIFKRAVITAEVTDEYLTDILRMMSDDGLIKGLHFKKTWGNEYILINDYDQMHITSAGIKYLEENSSMKKIKEAVMTSTGIITELVKLVL